MKQRRAHRTAPRVLLALAALGLMLMLVPAVGASSGRSMRVILEKVRVRHGRPLHAGRRALRQRRHSRRAHAAIVGGSPTSIAQAPWQVLVLARVSAKESLVCGGSILTSTKVLTAGHCVIDPATKEQFATGEITIRAGTADFEVIEPGEQVSRASRVRVHPDYVWNPEATQAIPDDVAVVELEKPLVLGATAEKIGLGPAGSPPQEGAQVNLTGFGAENALTGVLDGGLNSIGMNVRYSGECGGQNNALFVCASNPAGSDCFGDSGSALTVPGSPATLTGVTDTAEVIEGKCFDGGVGGFANVAAPEIRDFILEPNMDPPRAPKGGGDSSIQGLATVGQALSCSPGSWSGAPTVTYAFLDAASRAVLEQGTSSVYPLTAADIGRAILCEVFAANAGGTGIGRTAALGPVRPNPAEQEDAAPRPSPSPAAQDIAGFHGAVSPVPDAKLASTALVASASGAVSIKITCPEAEASCSGTVTLRTVGAVIPGTSSANAKAAVLTLAKGSFTVAGGKVKTVTLRLSVKARALLRHSHVMRVRATIVAHDQAGATHTTRTVVTLRSPKAKSGKG